jgi:glycosyltransferase involved in cell wall biosynthesis
VPRVVFIEGKEQLGTFGSYHKIFEQADGDFFCQLDADDWLHPNAIRACVDALSSQPEAPFAYSQYLEVSESGESIRIGQRSLSSFNQQRMLVQFITFHLRVIRSNAYRKVGGYDPSLLYTGDYDLSLKLCELGDPLYIPSPLYFYRLHRQNTSSVKRKQTIQEAFTVAEQALHRRRQQHLFSLELDTNACRVHLRRRQGPILIAGMHRSGTSLLGLTLKQLGLDLGSQLLRADQQNPDGYMEDAGLVELQRSLLQKTCRTQKGWPDWGWEGSSGIHSELETGHEWLIQAKAYLQQRRRNSHYWGWKDPRNTLLLDLWLSLDPGLRVIGIFRHPWEIIDALQRVQPPIFLANPSWALKIWTQYNQALLRFAEQHPERCILVSSEALRDDPTQLPPILDSRWGWFSASAIPCPPEKLRSLIRPDRLQQHALNDPLIALHQQCSPEAWSLLNQLNDCADLPSPLKEISGNKLQETLRLRGAEKHERSATEISIVITSYNEGDLLLEAIASVERNAPLGTGLELLIVDDGSTDSRTREVLSNLDKLGYRVLRQSNQGLSAARNHGIRASHGPILLFLDDDNRLLKPYLSLGLAMLRRQTSIDVVYGDRIDFGLKQQQHQVGLVSQTVLWEMNRIDNCTLIRRTVFERCGGYDTALPAFEDWDLWLRTMAHPQGLKLGYISQPCFEYRVRPNSMLQRLFQDHDLQQRLMAQLRQRHGPRLGHGGFQPRGQQPPNSHQG